MSTSQAEIATNIVPRKTAMPTGIGSCMSDYAERFMHEACATLARAVHSHGS
jgi:hypothetical protein